MFELAPLAPGNWQIAVTLQDGAPWMWRTETVLSVAAAERVEWTLDFELAWHAIELLDAETGEALTTESVYIGQRDSDGSVPLWIERDLDAQPRLELALPPGTYAVTRHVSVVDAEQFDPATCAVLEWTSQGPRTSSLRVPK